MIQGQYLVRSNTPLTKSMMQLSLEGDTSAIKAPGQFVNIKLDGFYLRRPLSVCDWNENRITLLYKIVGDGTRALSRMVPGQSLDVLCGLGNGFMIDKGGKKPLLIGGGAGIAPMYGLGRVLLERGVEPTVVLGFNTREEIFYKREMEAAGLNVVVCTADGSFGAKGYPSDLMGELEHDYFYACGPEADAPAPSKRPRARPASTASRSAWAAASARAWAAPARTKYGNKRICKDGPVLMREESHMVSTRVSSERHAARTIRSSRPAAPSATATNSPSCTTSTVWARSPSRARHREPRFGNPTPRIAECPSGHDQRRRPAKSRASTK